MVDLKIDGVKKIVSANGYKKVIVLLPAGVMANAGDLIEAIPEPIFMANPCYGACDVPLHLLNKFGADAIFNFGHSKPLSLDYPENVHFFEIKAGKEVSHFVPDFKRVGIVFVIQFKDFFERYAKILEDAGKSVFLGKSPDFMATYSGQITGCDIGAARKLVEEVDGFVVACDGLFHANAVASLGKPTYNWNGEKAEAPRFPMAALFKANKVGIVVGEKLGQSYEKEAREVKTKLESMGKQVFLAVGDIVTPEISNFQVDFWVVAACPRIAEDEYLAPSAPVHEVLKYI